jgi:hypothetical protein
MTDVTGRQGMLTPLRHPDTSDISGVCLPNFLIYIDYKRNETNHCSLLHIVTISLIVQVFLFDQKPVSISTHCILLNILTYALIDNTSNYIM